MMGSIVNARIAVVYSNNPDAPGAVLRRSANMRPWKSYESVATALCESLRSMGLDATTLPDGTDLVGRLRDNGIDLVWLNTGGMQGEAPLCHTPAMLEAAGVPYVGHTPLNAALLDDKGAFKLALAGLGFPTARFVIWNAAQGGRKGPTSSPAFKRTFGPYAGPFVVKPVNGRASQNVEFVESIGNVDATVSQIASKTGCLILVEEFMSGPEYCVAVMGGGPGGAFGFSAVERVLMEDERVFTSMDVKAITSERVRALDASEDPLDAQIAGALFDLAEEVYEAFNLTSIVRLDVRSDARGKLHILEANPKPDLTRPSETSTSLIAEGLPSLGWSYDDLVACMFVERLWQLRTRRPQCVEHFLSEGVTGDALLSALPGPVRAVLLSPARRAGRAPCGEGEVVEEQGEEQQELSEEVEDADSSFLPAALEVYGSFMASEPAANGGAARRTAGPLEAGKSFAYACREGSLVFALRGAPSAGAASWRVSSFAAAAGGEPAAGALAARCLSAVT